MQEGISGKIAHFFINSKLTILLMVGLMIIGVYSSFLRWQYQMVHYHFKYTTVLLKFDMLWPFLITICKAVSIISGHKNCPVHCIM